MGVLPLGAYLTQRSWIWLNSCRAIPPTGSGRASAGGTAVSVDGLCSWVMCLCHRLCLRPFTLPQLPLSLPDMALPLHRHTSRLIIRLYDFSLPGPPSTGRNGCLSLRRSLREMARPAAATPSGRSEEKWRSA